MSKQYNIRWTQNDVKELQRLAKNFNAKVSRLEKKYGGNPDVFLPDRVTVAQMRENIGTRRDLQRELKSLQSFTQRGSDELVKIQSVNSITDNNILLTKWQKQEMQSRAKSINDKRRYHRKKLESVELEHDGKSLGYTRGDIGMGTVEANQLKPTKPFNRRMTKGDMRAKFEHFQRESKSDYWIRRDELMRESYIKALRSNFNEEDIKGIIEQIEKMPIRTFKNKLLSDPADFDTAYPMNGNDKEDEEYMKYLNKLNTMWIPKRRSRTKAAKPKNRK